MRTDVRSLAPTSEELSNKQAERQVLGAMIFSQEACVTALDKLSPQDFYSLPNEKIFRAIATLYNSNKGIDLTTLSTQLDYEGKLEEVGGRLYLVSLVEGINTDKNIAYHCAIVRNEGVRRRVYEELCKSFSLVKDKFLEPDELVSKVSSGFIELSRREINDRETKPSLVEKIALDPEPPIYTGIKSLDKATGGVHNGDVVVIGGRPSLGKTALATAVAENIALNVGPVAFFSKEMSKSQIEDRVICSRCGIDIQRWMNRSHNGLTTEEKTAFFSKQEELRKLENNLIIIDYIPSVQSLRVLSKLHKTKDGIKLIVFDYIQLLSTKGDDNNEISFISRTIKDIARSLSVPFIALSQLNREAARRPGQRPNLADLRGSGSIEQDADQVWFPYNPAQELKNNNYEFISDEDKDLLQEWSGKVQVIVAKHRNGPLSTTNLSWIPEYTRISDLH